MCLAVLCLAGCNPSDEEDLSHSDAVEAFRIPFNQNPAQQLQDGDYSWLKVHLSGAAEVVSLKLQSSRSLLAGRAYYFPKLDEYALSDGQNFIVANLTEGLPHEEEYVVALAVCPGDYTGELSVTVCDSRHRVMTAPVSGAGVLEPGMSYDVNVAFSPDSEILFYEGFDLCVYGGNYPSGPGSDGYVPAVENSDSEADPAITGYEQADVKVAYDVPGSGYIQAGSWDEVSSSSVADFHAVSESYIVSRNFMDFGSLWRCQEFQGCLGVGVTGTSRGVFQTSPFAQVGDAPTDVEFSFDMCLMSTFDDDFSIRAINGGQITAVSYNGVQLDVTADNPTYMSSYSEYIIPRAIIAENLGRKSRVVVNITRASSVTTVRLGSAVNASGNKGFFLDELTLRKAEARPGVAKSLKVLYWNIQYGMWGDQGNNYDNFVKWVKLYDPDVCVWCETASVYKTDSGEYLQDSDNVPLKLNLSDTAPFLKAWKDLAARYGHSYVASSGIRDNYPQIVSSKYPLEVLQQVTIPSGQTDPIAHGMGMFRFKVHGEEISLVSVHLYPQKYRFGVSAQEQEESAARREGDWYREWEMKQILALTVNNPSYRNVSNWIYCGDFNSRSWMDKWFYDSQNNKPADSEYLVHDAIKASTSLVDLIGNFYLGQFHTSNAGAKRPDYIYLSTSMFAKVHDAYVVKDGWCSPEPAITHINPETGSTVIDLYRPADHRPIFVEFDMDVKMQDNITPGGIQDLNPIKPAN